MDKPTTCCSRPDLKSLWIPRDGDLMMRPTMGVSRTILRNVNSLVRCERCGTVTAKGTKP